MPADVVFINGKFTTLGGPADHAQAVAVTGGRFSAVGTRAEIE